MRRFVIPDAEELEPDLDDWVDDLPHGGLWSRPAGEDALRCAEHGLTRSSPGVVTCWGCDLGFCGVSVGCTAYM
jgi:hypothetical protein